MAWQTGTSTDWQDLLNDLQAFAEANGWTTDRDATAVGGDSNVNEWIAHGSGGGSDAIYVGVRTYYASSPDARNWELAGFTGYASANTWENQPGISFGRYNGSTDAEKLGSYVALQNTTISYWFSVTSRRIIMVAKCGTDYEWAYMGWMNPAGTSGEYPYPLCIAGSTAHPDTRFNSTRVSHSSIADPRGYDPGNTGTNGPIQVRDKAGVWRTIQNAYEGNANAITYVNGRVMFPVGIVSTTSAVINDPADRWFSPSSAILKFTDMTRHATLASGDEVNRLYKSNDSGGDKAALFPCTPLSAPDTNEHEIYGELDDVFCVSAAPGITGASIASEDTITVGADTYHVFQGANRTDSYAFCAVKQG